ALALAGCPEPCPAEPLAPTAEAPRWVARVNDRATVEAPTNPLPGPDPAIDPPGTGRYAAFALYPAEGPPLNDRWLDSFTRWDGATVSVDAATTVPRALPPGELTLLAAAGGRPILGFSLATGAPLTEVAPWDTPPTAGGQLVDRVRLDAGTAVASRARTEDGRGSDLVRLDLLEGAGPEPLALSALSPGPVRPGRLARLGEDTVLVGLALPDEPGAGAVAVVNARTGDTRRVDLPGLRSCVSVVALPPDPDAPDEARAGVLCTADPTAPPGARAGVGFALVAVEDGGAVRVAATRPAEELFADRPPTGGLVALAGDWVAAVSRGDPSAGRPDALLAADLSSDAGALLYEEAWTERWGEALGEGGYAADLAELRWPSVQGGILRWQMRGEGPSAAFTPLEAAPAPGCSRLPVRVVRALPAATP
ncbi:MAG TPA: hypothetical protein RMH99_01300, partial [Sandaracinaceae bacterium LLY-WYZ-13_1]|nr:hypothetical protein [Sandaracinaceae bacterium LLY-WYZ-13_1]